MLSEKILFALNSVDDSFLMETEAFLKQPAAPRKTVKRKTVRTLLIAAVIAALMGATAYAIGYTIHQRRQQELRESLKIEENHVSGYTEFEENNVSGGEPASETEEAKPSVQLISTFQKGEFADVYFSVSPITKEEAWDAIGWEHKNAIYVIASNNNELDDAYRRKGDEARKDLYVRFPVLPPVQEDEYLQVHETREELLEKYYDADSQSLMLRAQFLLDYDPVDWNKPVYLNVKIIELSSLASSMDETMEEYWERYDPVCVRDYGTVPVTVSDAEYIENDFRGKEISIQVPESNKVLQLLGMKIYAAQVEWQFTHEDIDLIFNLPRDDDEAFRRGFELQLEWLAVYNQVLDASELLLDDGSRVKLGPSESAPYEDGVVTLYSHWGSTVDLSKVSAVSVMGQEVPIQNPFREKGA